MNEIDEATAASKDIKKRARLAGAGWNGFNFFIGATQYWAGVYYSKPQTLVFQTQDVSKTTAEQVGMGHVTPTGKDRFKWVVNEIDLESEAVHFFALSPDNQQRTIEEFVMESVSRVKKAPI
jgi:hypothetical protein